MPTPDQTLRHPLPVYGEELINKDDGLYVRQYGKSYDEGYKDYKVIKVYESMTGWFWIATEYTPRTGIFFGFVQGDFNEWGTFSKTELEELAPRVWEVGPEHWSYTGRRGLL